MNTDNEYDIDNRLVALDLECTTGFQKMDEGAILSIGMVHVGSDEEFYYEMKYDHPIVVNPESMTHNDIDIEQVHVYEEGKRTTVNAVDGMAHEWLKEVTGVSRRHKLVAVGAGVNRYDLPYMSRCAHPMPRTKSMFTWASLDLTTVFKGLDICAGHGMGTVKKKLREVCEGEHTHNALEDARLEAQCIREIRQHVDLRRFW